MMFDYDFFFNLPEPARNIIIFIICGIIVLLIILYVVKKIIPKVIGKIKDKRLSSLFCPRCKKVSENKYFCSRCGYNLKHEK